MSYWKEKRTLRTGGLPVGELKLTWNQLFLKDVQFLLDLTHPGLKQGLLSPVWEHVLVTFGVASSRCAKNLPR